MSTGPGEQGLGSWGAGIMSRAPQPCPRWAPILGDNSLWAPAEDPGHSNIGKPPCLMFPCTWAWSVLALVPLLTPPPIAAECVPWEFPEALSCLSWSPLCSVSISLSSPLVMGTELAALTGECPLPIPLSPHRSNQSLEPKSLPHPEPGS